MNVALQRCPGLVEATEPPELRDLARDAVKMLVTERANRKHTHARFFDLPDFLRAGDLLVVNDSATLPAAVHARRPNGMRLMLHLATKLDERLWIVEPRASVLAGEKLRLDGWGSAVPIAPLDPDRPRLWYVSFHIHSSMEHYLSRHGEPIRYGYMRRRRFPLSYYQTYFARNPGSAEMPSAARPFTEGVVQALQRKGVQLAAVTLHTGVSSFEQPERPGVERYTVSPQTARSVRTAKSEGRRVIAIGTTVVRALESSLADDEIIASGGFTDLVIDAGFRPRAVDALLTGFHDSAATHQWILKVFLDADLLADAYEEASCASYYQHEFGDVHLIL